MSIELFVSLTSLGGVLLGGCLSYAVQRATQRTIERSESKRARHAERMAIVERLLVSSQDAERAAADRHYGGADGTDWKTRADAAMDRTWIAEKMVRIFRSDPMHEAAHAYVNALNDAIHNPRSDSDLWGTLAPTRKAVLEAAQRELQ